MLRALRQDYSRLARADGGRALAYARLREVLQQAIDGGRVTAGQPLPSERDLAEALKLSRVTVRKALSGLVDAGLLVQRRGAGTFVAGERIVKPFSRLTSFSDDLRARGLDPRSEVLERGIGEVTPDEAMALDLSPGTRVVRLHRVRHGGGQPLAIERSVVPQALLPDPLLVRHSLYDALEARGHRPVRALQRLRAVAFDARQARQLALPVGSPGLLIERRAFLADGRAVEFTRSWYRGDAYDFVAELHSEGGTQ
ncbi:GntR family transcriptional regulator [Chiayiivirga flava]|uniref:GntR family transcriptional regulator n=1 Tax=Chiayiivirga flava TaxID=659595 RepID=A0A7W8D8J5_9GAMM|nr:GntR family transcriptional regulator [Chiayiivirga flava]MBB5208740.1 GntR family transcriptional regulator [Chiayiivirga flava]